MALQRHAIFKLYTSDVYNAYSTESSAYENQGWVEVNNETPIGFSNYSGKFSTSGGPTAPRLDSLGVTDVCAISSLADELHMCLCGAG